MVWIIKNKDGLVWIVLSYSGLGQGRKDECQNLLLVKQTIHKIFQLEDEEIFIETFEKHLKSQEKLNLIS